MAKLSPKGEAWPVLKGFEKLLGRGKVRDGYQLPNRKRLVVVTDRISALDYVLNELIPMKGIALNVATVFWLKYLEQFGIKHHMVAYGAGIDEYLTGEAEYLRGDVDLQSRAMVVEDLQMCDKEFVYRACLTGSSLKPYMETGMVCGHKLPPGLQDGDELPQMLFTPTTKAQEGHDLHISADEVMAMHPEQAKRGLLIFRLAYDYAKARGIILPDTKFEISVDNILADEVLTPDSSRYWSCPVWLEGRKIEEGRKAPPSFDKEPIRTWLKAKITEWVKEHPEELAKWVAKLGNPKIKGFDPEIPECVDVVQGFEMPKSLIRQTTQGYRYIDWRLIDKTVDRFRIEDMGIKLPEPKPKNVLLLCGSRSDYNKYDIGNLVASYNSSDIMLTAGVGSCHRKPEDIRRLPITTKYDLIVGLGGDAFAQPGVIDSWVHFFNTEVRVAGVALGDPGSEGLLAAQLSIKKLPSQPVIMDEIVGEPYTGVGGLRKLLDRVIHGELPPVKPRKEAEFEPELCRNF